jgi:hypothetical protein
MAVAKTERRAYAVSPNQLFGICITALAQLRATIAQHDVEQGLIDAAFGEAPLAPTSELSVALHPLGEGQTELVATWRALRRRADRRLLAVFLAAVDALIRQA